MNIFQWLVWAGVGIFLTVAVAQDPAPTNVRGLMTASEAYEKAEKEMGEAYSKLMIAVNSMGKERLKKAQSSWVQYRDAESAFNCHHLAGGPYERMEYYAQLRKETDRRTRDLKRTYEWMRQIAIKEQ